MVGYSITTATENPLTRRYLTKTELPRHKGEALAVLGRPDVVVVVVVVVRFPRSFAADIYRAQYELTQ